MQNHYGKFAEIIDFSIYKQNGDTFISKVIIDYLDRQIYKKNP